MNLTDLKSKNLSELSSLAAELNIDSAEGLRRQDLIVAILRAQSARNVEIRAQGVLEVLSEGFGFLRATDANYLPGPDDIYVSPSQIRRFSLRTGDTVAGVIRAPKESERYFALLRVENVNQQAPDNRRKTLSFDELTPVHPTVPIHLADGESDPALRMIDLICPIGRGQRCLITGPAHSGKTALLKKIATTLARHHSELQLIVLLIDERPEEVTDFHRAEVGDIVASTFDEPIARHVQVAEIAIEKAKRYAESDGDAIVLINSMSRLARAYNCVVPASGRLLGGDLDPAALHKCKRIFGTARNLEESGSLTIVATSRTSASSTIDGVITDDLRVAANTEIALDPNLVDGRLFPGIAIHGSVTRNLDNLFTGADLEARRSLVSELHALSDRSAADQLAELMAGAASNGELLAGRR